MRVLLTGADGQLGRALQSVCPEPVDIMALGRAGLDINHVVAVRNLVARYAPHWILNAAAYTDVDRAEEEPALARAINEAAVANLAQASRDAGARLLHLSTDFVFDGGQRRPYRPTDPTAPLSVYGTTKRDGENAALTATDRDAVVVRTAWIYSYVGRNFLTTMLRLMQHRESLAIVNDQRGTPTSAHDLADAIWKLIAAEPPGGIYHYTNQGEATWYEFAQAIHTQLRLRQPRMQLAVIEPTDTAGFPTLAKRPAYSVLNSKKMETIVGNSRSWETGLQNVMSNSASRSS